MQPITTQFPVTPMVGLQLGRSSAGVMQPGTPLSPKDTFGVIGDATLFPSGHKESAMSLSVLQDGTLAQNTLSGRQAIGQLNTQGNFRLANGLTGNIFREGLMNVSYRLSPHPFFVAMRQNERLRAAQSSEIPLIREQLTRLGIDGSGIKIGIIDPYDKDKPKGEGADSSEKKPPSLIQPLSDKPQEHWKLPEHSLSVAATIKDPVWGVAPGAQVVDAGFIFPAEIELANDFVKFRDAQIRGIAGNILARSIQIMQLLLHRDPALRILNITSGTSRVGIYANTINGLSALDENLNYKYPLARKAILGPAEMGTDDEKLRAVIRYVDNQVFSSPQIQQAQAWYVEATRQAATHGLITIASAANDHDIIDTPVPMPPGSEMNEYAKSPYVISVAASNSNQTPGYYLDDVIANFSSLGDGHLYNPTITAPGEEIGINHPYGPIGKNGVVRGTSYSTPFTCGVVAMMLQRNPGLTFEQIRSKLQQTATLLPNYPIEAQGAGVINPIRAVLQV